MALVVDLGGTNLRAAIAGGPPPRLDHLTRAPTAAIDDLGAWLEAYLSATGAPRPDRCLLAVAGPVGAGRVRLTNAELDVDTDALRERLGMPAELVNDFTAIALSIPALAESDRRPLDTASARPGHAIAVLGPGTGLGVSGLIPQDGGWAAVAGEGGHVTLPAGRAPDEQAARAALGDAFVSAEDVLSGPGLARLYSVLAPAPAALTPAEIAARATTGTDPVALHAVQLFTLWLGRFAGDLALTLGAQGGVYIAGGILPAWGTLFDPATFRRGFEDKAAFREYVAAIPAYLVTHPQPGLLGLAARAGCA